RSRSITQADNITSCRSENNKNKEEKYLAQENNSVKGKLAADLNEPTLNITSVDQLFGLDGIDLSTPLELGSSAFDKFLSQHKLAMADDSITKIGPGKRNNDLPTTREQQTSQNRNIKPSKISNNNNTISSNLTTTTSTSRNSLIPNDLLKPGKRMLSEAEVLQSLGAKPPNISEISQSETEDVVGFNKILAALAKGNSSDVQQISQTVPNNIPSSSSLSSTVNNLHSLSSTSNQSLPSVHQTTVTTSNNQQPAIPFNDPSIINSTKKINMLLGGNVPTSVYRQLSSRSENGSRESSAGSSPALKYPKTNFSNYPPHSPPLHSTNLSDM
ncbi:11038_t:CDS:2, partial [Entrophospora sp. SA101]